MKEPCRLAADEAQLAAVAQRLERRSLEPGDYEILKVVIDTVCFLSRQVQQKATSIQRLLRLIFGARTEKTATVLKQTASNRPSPGTASEAGQVKRNGHGRRAASCFKIIVVTIAIFARTRHNVRVPRFCMENAHV